MYIYLYIADSADTLACVDDATIHLVVSSYKESRNNKPMYGYMQERIKRVTRSYLIYALLLYMYVNPICALALTYTKYKVFTITM